MSNSEEWLNYKSFNFNYFDQNFSFKYRVISIKNWELDPKNS
ncbi:hypothetical protein SAMN04488104_100771 [Algoriphagus faecimaris]|uniref:Uncharacterized protein n=1 Tax=Algoriphagus faecimaris TaxID=686796 RepID=A0A1G6PVG3_9BACT|nr:hypothetical protein SAMN04488104_100771 [Algoriphagus faecimaris]